MGLSGRYQHLDFKVKWQFIMGDIVAFGLSMLGFLLMTVYAAHQASINPRGFANQAKRALEDICTSCNH